MSGRVEALYREHGEAVFRYLTRMSGCAETAADVLQDTFRKLVERPPENEENLRGWLFRVATNRLRDLQRKTARRARLLEGADAHRTLGDPPPEPDRAVARSEAHERAQQILGELDPRDRAILLMREEGFTHREIAEVVGTTTGSVGTMIARALDRATQAASVLEKKS